MHEYYTMKFDTPSNVSDIVKDLINKHTASREYRMYIEGEAYYLARNTKIMRRKQYYYQPILDDSGKAVSSKLLEDPYKANNIIPHGFMKILIDQKLQYLLGNKVNFNDETKDDIAEILGDTANKKFKQIAKSAAKKSVGWAYVFTDEENKFKFIQIKPEEIIPLYNINEPEKIDIIIRYYPISVVDEDGDVGTVNRAEIWDKQIVTFYQETSVKDNTYRLCYSNEIGGFKNPHTHFIKNVEIGDLKETKDDVSWGRVPFVPMFNNDEEVNDLQFVKNIIDVYDYVTSDFANNLEDFQDVLYILKGYNGENLDEFLQQVKEFKIIKTNEDGDARPETIDIPHEARTVMLKQANDNIFKFGMGVDIQGLAGGSNVTNVMIKAAYGNLDLKADEFETEVRDFLNSLLWFVNRFQEINNDTAIENVEITFNRSLIINETEMLAANAGQKANVSKELQMQKHPWVEDVKKEIEQKKKEDEENVFDTGEVPEPQVNNGENE